MQTNYLNLLMNTALPCHFDFAGKLDLKDESAHFGDEVHFVYFKVFVAHL